MMSADDFLPAQARQQSTGQTLLPASVISVFTSNNASLLDPPTVMINLMCFLFFLYIPLTLTIGKTVEILSNIFFTPWEDFAANLNQLL